MYQQKAVFFDQQVNESWAADEYDERERNILKNVFARSGTFRKMKILEPGCGTGRLTRILSDRAGPCGLVVALDISPNMVKTARKRLEGRKNVQVHLTSLEEMISRENSHESYPGARPAHPAADGRNQAENGKNQAVTGKNFFKDNNDNIKFDIIICHQVFPHFEDKHNIVVLMHEMLKKKGRLIIHHFISLKQINDIHRKAGTTVQNDTMPGSEEMKALFTESGFKIIFMNDDENGYFLKAVKL